MTVILTVLCVTLLVVVIWALYAVDTLRTRINTLQGDLDTSDSRKNVIEHTMFDYDTISTEIIEWMKENAYFKDAGIAKGKYKKWRDTVMKLGENYRKNYG